MRNPPSPSRGFVTVLAHKLENISKPVGFILLGLFIFVWTTYHSIIEMPVALKHDMTEAYSWGQEFQLGYHQHPPFWAWVCGVWFTLFPSNLLSFAALSATNAAIGVWGVWCLTAKLVKDPAQRLTARLLPLLTPLYTFYAFKFNANIIFLSLWPWTLFFFFAATEQKEKKANLLFGIMVGLNLLSKYYALLPLSGCLLAACCTSAGRLWLRSLQPWRAFGVAALIVSPHIFWLIEHQAPPIAYLRTKLGLPWHDIALAAFKATCSFWGMMSGVLVLLGIFALRSKNKPYTLRPLAPTYTTWVGVVSLTPVLLTLLFGLGMKTVIMAEMMIGIVPLLPLFLFQVLGRYSPQALARTTVVLVLAVTACALIGAPLSVLWRVDFTKGWQKQLPIQDIALKSTQLWVEKTHAPLVYVSGMAWYANGTSFYSPGHPHSLPNHDPALALWVTPELIHQYGLLSICPNTPTDTECLSGAAQFATPQTVKMQLSMAHHFAGHIARPQTYTVVITPPSP